MAREASTLTSVLPTRDGTVTPATSVSQSSNPPICECRGGLLPLVSAKGIHLRQTWARVGRTRPHGRSLGRPLEPRGPVLGSLPGDLSGPRPPLSPGGCPRHPLTPAGHLHPAISGPLPPRGWDTRGRGASNGPTWRQTRRPLVTSPPLRRSPCSSIRKGVPLYGWKNRGEAPRRWLSSEPRLLSLGPRSGAAHAQAGPLTTSLSAGNGPHP